MKCPEKENLQRQKEISGLPGAGRNWGGLAGDN